MHLANELQVLSEFGTLCCTLLLITFSDNNMYRSDCQIVKSWRRNTDSAHGIRNIIIFLNPIRYEGRFSPPVLLLVVYHLHELLSSFGKGLTFRRIYQGTFWYGLWCCGLSHVTRNRVYLCQ